ncbi:MAG: hypothetical protein NW201_06035 [Gemmatimonadales bacterium]|nr:hypothetical protein [Gemmatimonadales bacterium]
MPPRMADGALLLGALAAAPLHAQRCDPGPGSNEARMLAMAALPLTFTGGRAPDPPADGRIALVLESALAPSVDPSVAIPSTCQPGKGPENATPLGVVARPRLAVQFGRGWTLEASWLPPVTRVAGVRTDLWGVALARTVVGPRGRGSLTLRGHWLFGSARAPITCPDASLTAPGPCAGGQRSDDRWSPNTLGVDLVAAGAGRLRPHLGVGVARLRPSLQVDRVTAGGQRDSTLVVASLTRAALFGGVEVPVGGVRVGAEAYWVPADAATLRTTVTVPLVRGGPAARRRRR